MLRAKGSLTLNQREYFPRALLLRLKYFIAQLLDFLLKAATRESATCEVAQDLFPPQHSSA
jgi:hypothetical protein